MYSRPQYNYKPAPAKDPIGQAMERKQEYIGGFQKSKESSIKIQSAGRDAVIITTTFYPEFATDPAKEEKIKAKIKEWNSWMHDTIYDSPGF